MTKNTDPGALSVARGKHLSISNRALPHKQPKALGCLFGGLCSGLFSAVCRTFSGQPRPCGPPNSGRST
jgi:hypothetical protein